MNSIRLKHPTTSNEGSSSLPAVQGRSSVDGSNFTTLDDTANDDTLENDPTMINRGSTIRRRTTTARKHNTLPPLPVVINVVTPPKKLRLKSSLWNGGCTSVTPTNPVVHPSNGNRTSSHSDSRNTDASHIDHCSSSGSGRTWQTLLRSNSKIHNLCRRIDMSTASNSLIHFWDCRSDHTAVHIDSASEDIEITPTHTRMPQLSQPKEARSIPIPSKFWWSSMTSPTGSTTMSTSPTSVDTTITSSISTIESEPSYNAITPKRPPQAQRVVRFHEDLNRIIDSELSPQHIKEYRKSMWWSHKDRVRSMKQRDSDLQNILKQNHPRKTEPRVLPVVLDHVETDAIQENTTDAIGRDSVTDDDRGPPALSEYCQAIVTLYRYCHEYTTTTKPRSDATTTPNSTTQSPPPEQGQPPSDPALKQAIFLIASSKYRGLERIVCKILQIQKVLSLSEIDVSHSLPISKLPTTPVTAHMEPVMAALFTAMEDTGTTTTLHDDDDNNDITTNETAPTILAHDSTIEVMLHTPPPSPHTLLRRSSLETNILDDTVASNHPMTTTTTLFEPIKCHSHTMSTAMYIRQCVLEYQNQWRKHERRHNSGRRHHESTNIFVHKMNNDEDSTDHDRSNQTNDSTKNETTTTANPISHQPVLENASVVPHDQPVPIMMDSSSMQLCQYYTSFPGHDISIVWAQLMAMGDALHST